MATLWTALALGAAFLFVKPQRATNNFTPQPGAVIPLGGSSSGYAAMDQQDMQIVQYDLAWLGYYYGPLTGRYDEATVESVISFQDDHGLRTDGKPGRETLEVLEFSITSRP